ncbi:hypothetical protein [Streptomyces sp. 150FB]|nr:hypothetical protein [Streptomyces sp. 150FB]
MKRTAKRGEQDDEKRLSAPQVVVDWLPVIAALVKWLIENV